ncbi:hypothetical protein CGRA01v4_14557 [Colletotrichum graminicola]|nr:hypothetical protein CGRA01v4_14557 [Colletotrichum graminicola]
MFWPVWCSFVALRPIRYAARSTQPGGAVWLLSISSNQSHLI